MLEGCAAAKVRVDAVRRIHGKPSRDKSRGALAGLSTFDPGELALNDSSEIHTGLDFVDRAIITSDGRFRR